MKLFNTIVPVLALLLLSEPIVPVYAESLNLNVVDTVLYSEYTLDGAEHIGFMPRVNVKMVDQNGAPVVGKVCGQWYLNGQVAPCPNIDMPQDKYCRKTDINGDTFFAYRYRYLEYTNVDLKFKVLELNTDSIFLFPNENFISLSF